MPQQIVYFPSGRGARVRECCDGCGTAEFAGEVVMAYDPQSGTVHLICEGCYRRQQAAAARRRWETEVRQQAARILGRLTPACSCGD